MTFFRGLAVVSSDYLVARDQNHVTSEWASAEDFRYLQECLDQADGCVMGRLTHEIYPNIRRRKRIILTRSVSCARKDNEWDMRVNPQGINSSEFFDVIEAHCGGLRLSILGGAEVYGFWLKKYGYHVFDLTVEHWVGLGSGIALFRDNSGNVGKPAEILCASGMVRETEKPLNDRGTRLYRYVNPGL